MGSGRWSTDVYSARESKRKASGKSAFEYSEKVKRSGKLKVHPSLDPFGVTYRESRDSAEHPATNAISVMFDVTGSMGGVPVQLQQYLPQLLGLLLYRDYIPHPQIMFGAIGDAISDSVPLQVGQFESDNRMDENLQNIVLERGGGPYGMESYELALYFMARHTAMDCYEKRKKKGYLFMIGDEMAYPKVDRKQVDSIMDGGLESSIRLEDIIAEVKERYNLYFIVPAAASGGNADRIYTFWKERLGEQHVIRLDKVASVAETIALTIGTNEGRIGLEDGVEDLKEMGSDASTISSVKKALSILPVSNSVVKSEGSLGNLDEKSNKTRRL